MPKVDDLIEKLADPDPNFLQPVIDVFDNAITNSDVICLPLDINPKSVARFTVIANDAILNQVAVGSAVFVFLFAKKNPNFPIIFNKYEINKCSEIRYIVYLAGNRMSLQLRRYQRCVVVYYSLTL